MRRNSTRNGKYVWTKAQESSDTRRSHSLGNRRLDSVLEWRIKELIRNCQWSPRQISGRLARDGVRVSHETVSTPSYAGTRAESSPPTAVTDSYCSWQKGAAENENKLVRQYIPKGTGISKVSDARIMAIRKKINARPREKLNFLTPKEVFFENIS